MYVKIGKYESEIMGKGVCGYPGRYFNGILRVPWYSL